MATCFLAGHQDFLFALRSSALEQLDIDSVSSCDGSPIECCQLRKIVVVKMHFSVKQPQAPVLNTLTTHLLTLSKQEEQYLQPALEARARQRTHPAHQGQD